MEATSKQSGSAKSKAQAHGDWTLRADLLNKLAEKSFLRSHLTGMWSPRVESKQAGVKTKGPSSAMWELGTQYQHMFSQDLLAFGGVDYQRNNTNTGHIDSNTAWVFTLGARYQF